MPVSEETLAVTPSSASQPLTHMRITGKPCQNSRLLRLTLIVRFHRGGVGVCLSDRLLGDADVSGPWASPRSG